MADATIFAGERAALALYPPTVEPAPRPLPLHKFIFRFVRNPLTSLPQAAYEEKIVRFDTPRTTVVWICDPALIERVLVRDAELFEKSPVEKRVFARTLGQGVLTSDGARWRWQRRAMAPMFRNLEITRDVPEMTRAAEEQVARWRQTPGDHLRAIDVDMVETTFAIIARTMLIGGEPAEAAIIKRETERSLKHISWELAYGMLNAPTWLPHPATWTLRRSAKKLRGAVAQIVARRRASSLSGDDLLGRLIAAQDGESGAYMDDEQIIDNLLTLLEAGHETTSRALSWTLYLLARAPEWQARLRAEIAAVTAGEAVNAGHLSKLVLTQQVLKESMRLYPPAPVMVRMCKVEVELGGETLPPGALIVIPIFCVHRHRQLWNDPDKFDPARFEAARETAYPRTQFMPFGGGQRICLGSAFAMAEATAVLATLIRSAHFEWDGKSFPEPVSRVTLQPKGGVWLRVSPV